MTGHEFERAIAATAHIEYGCWAHMMAPGADGGQPFDVLVLTPDGTPIAIECKVLSKGGKLPLSRLEVNQVCAMDMFLHQVCGARGYIAAFDGRQDEIYMVPFPDMARLAAGHAIDPAREGVPLCEIFGRREDTNL